MRKSRSWWHGITPGGLIVAVTSAVTTLAITATACYLLVTHQVDAGLQVLGTAGFSAVGTSSLAARLRQDPAATVDQPATVTATSEATE